VGRPGSLPNITNAPAMPTAAAAPPASSVSVTSAKDSPDSGPEVDAKETEVVAPRRNRPKMISLTLLDGTTISLPTPKRRSKPPTEEVIARKAPPGEELSDQLTARDLVSALRAVAHGADASEILGTEPRWEALFSALLSVMLRKGLIADWEFVEEFRKI
jgi:hypothetical protein